MLIAVRIEEAPCLCRVWVSQLGVLGSLSFGTFSRLVLHYLSWRLGGKQPLGSNEGVMGRTYVKLLLGTMLKG